MNLKTVIASIYKILALVLVLAVLFPSVIKLSHAFNHHKHDVCNENIDTHFHQTDLDCDFYKFKLNKNHFFIVAKYDEKSELPLLKQGVNHFTSFYSHQQLSRFLRGPPQLV